MTALQQEVKQFHGDDAISLVPGASVYLLYLQFLAISPLFVNRIVFSISEALANR